MTAASTPAAIAAELMREESARMEAYKVEVAKGRMTLAQADYGTAIFRTMAEDVRRLDAAGGHQTRARDLVDQSPAQWPLAALRRFAWAERRDAIQREIDRRRRLYPDWIAKGRITQADADRRLSLITAALDLFEEGLDFAEGWPAYAQIHVDYMARKYPASIDGLRSLLPDCTFPAEQQSLAV